MTTVDKYLNKYLEGSITELEMQEFRDLIESEPQLQLELRHTLDLRSLVHDDLLALNPPEFLSTSVKDLVGERFAALAEEKEEERRRPIFFTERIAGSFVMAMVALVLVALAPTLIAPSGSTNGGSASEIAALETGDPSGTDRTPAATFEPEKGVPATPSRNEVAGRNRHFGDRKGNAPAKAAEQSIRTSDLSVAIAPNNETLVNPAAPANPNLRNQPAENIGTIALLDENNGQHVEARIFPPRLDLDILLRSTNGNNELRLPRSISTAADRQAAMIEEGYGRENSRYPDHIAATTVPAVSDEYGYESPNAFSPRIAFGFTVGAGALTNSSSSVALTQGAGYAALSLSESNRIGIEAGGSKFRYTYTTYTQEVVPLAKSNTTGVEEWRSTANGGPDNLGGVYQIYGTSGRGNGGTGNGATQPQSHPGSINDPTQIDGSKENGASLFGGGGSPVSQPPASFNAIIRSHTYEADTSMGYGMFFYDRRIVSLNKELNIRSRVGVGGTDGGVILDLRAYAAFATNQNVAVTVGVGGSALRELSQNGKLSANYGVQVGAELGF